MPSAKEFESLSSSAAGIYRQNALYVRMESLFDLEPGEKREEEPVPGAAAMHVHEYVHYLHNVSTVAGQAYLAANIVLLRALSGACDEGGYFLGVEHAPALQRDWLTTAATMMETQLGSVRAAGLGSCRDFGKWRFASPCVVVGVDEMPSATAVVTARDPAGELKSETISIGMSFVTEGIAYEVDREMRRLSGIAPGDLDGNTANFPYLAYRAALESWTGRLLTPHDLIAVGVASLGYPFPGAALVNLCRLLSESDKAVADVIELSRAERLTNSQVVLDKLRELSAGLVNGGPVETGIAEYVKLVEAGTRLREGSSPPEFAFLSGPLTSKNARDLMGSMLDCFVIQDRPGGVAEMAWIGPGHAAKDKSVFGALASLQAAIHFSQLHQLRSGQPVPTSLLPRKTVCPFSGGCQVERNDQFPDACRLAPWERFRTVAVGEQVCWYAAGVKTLGSTARATM